MEFTELEENTKGFSDYVEILKRRKNPMLLVASVILLITLLALMFWPPTYRSTATILIEEQEIPRDLVRSTITSFAAQQIQVINQRIMTVTNIMELVDKFKLYQVDGELSGPRMEIATRFRDDVTMDLVSADVIDPESGRPTEATIAFTLSFDYRSADQTQKVTNELVTLYLNENLRARNLQSANTSDFLLAEANSLRDQLLELESSLADFKERNEGSLPELYDFNITAVDRTERELLEASLRIQELEKRKIELGSELAQLSPSAPMALPSGEMVLSDSDRLKALQSDYRRKSALYHDSHPDVRRLKREIEELEATTGLSSDREEILHQLDGARDELTQLKSKYADDNAKVTTQERVIAQLERDAANSSGSGKVAAPDNPAYVLLNTQIQSASSEIRSLQLKQEKLQAKIASHEAKILRAPSVEKDYKALLRDYENATLKYREIKAKQMEANLAKNLEQDRKGERFTLIDPAQRPVDPVSPNRIALLLVGLVLSVFGSLAAAALLELMDSGVRGEKALTEVLGGVAPISVIPYIENETDADSQLKLKTRIKLTLVIGAIILLILIHVFYKPLDVIWFILLNKLGLS